MFNPNPEGLPRARGAITLELDGQKTEQFVGELWFLAGGIMVRRYLPKGSEKEQDTSSQMAILRALHPKKDPKVTFYSYQAIIKAEIDEETSEED